MRAPARAALPCCGRADDGCACSPAAGETPRSKLGAHKVVLNDVSIAADHMWGGFTLPVRPGCDRASSLVFSQRALFVRERETLG